MTEFCPADAGEVRDVVAWAMADEQPLELLAGGSKRPFGRPLQVAHVLDLSRLSGIVDYEPAELVLTAHAATPLEDIEAALAGNGQRLAFEPPDWRRLLGTEARRQTIGGVLACNLAGPRRIVAGAARDHFLGFQGVNGRGELFKAGGRVVKNVTGYDLCKLLAGSHGTLAALTEVSIKVLPRPPMTHTLLLCGLDDEAAVRAMAQALNSPHEVCGAAHLPAAMAARSGVAEIGTLGQAITALRLEGPELSVAYRIDALRREFAATAAETLLDAASVALWREIGDVTLLAAAEFAVWRVSVAPASGARVAAAVADKMTCAVFYDWGGGLLWLGIVGRDDCGAAVVRAAVAGQGGGHATLLRAPEAARASQPVFETLAAPLAALSARVKASFDPRGVLNPGRIRAGL